VVKWTLKGHSCWVNDIAFLLDGITLSLASDDMTVRLWDVATGVGVWMFQINITVARLLSFFRGWLISEDYPRDIKSQF
jgi:WD40 repeat protein